jgi:NAD(P)-dependent dehydrogenase (short-subunit alcohol dehydrogenase family)
MLRTLAALVFYTRFFLPFSTIGHRRRLARSAPVAVDFRGQTWWVTGATGGIGRAIALGALRGGATVVALGRDARKLEALRRDAGADAIRLQAITVDLARLDATLALAQPGPRVDVLVHNVGAMQHGFATTGEGVETGFATNLLVPFALTETLRATGRLDAESRIISVSSGGAYGAKLDLDALEARDATTHDGFLAYAQHKRAQIELTRWWNAQPKGPRAWVMHPGWVDTDGVRTALPGFRRTLRQWLRTPEQGADTALWLAAARPAPHPDGGLWLDRERDSEHAFAMTRGGASAEALARHLNARWAGVG